MIPAKPFYMIRHGESVANRDGYFSGQMDVALTETGIMQAETARVDVEKLVEKPTHILHSHLSRARDTASIINNAMNLPMFEDVDISEHGFGAWEGQSPSEIRPLVDQGIDPPGGEPHDVFAARVFKAIEHAFDHGNLPLIVCHGGVFRGFAHYYGEKIRGIQNCVLYRFDPMPEKSPMPWVMTEKASEQLLKPAHSQKHHGPEIL